MDHIKFASELGHLVAIAKFAAENPELEQKLELWKGVSEEQKVKLLELGLPSRNQMSANCISRYTKVAHAKAIPSTTYQANESDSDSSEVESSGQ